MIRQRFCEALYATGRSKEAGESLLNIVNTVDKDVCMTTRPIIAWISGTLCYPFFPHAFESSPQIFAAMPLHPRKQC